MDLRSGEDEQNELEETFVDVGAVESPFGNGAV
jgi:hypothetical protein